MRRTPLLAALAAATFPLAAPAEAMAMPACETHLAATAYHYCSTDNVPEVRGFVVRRTVRVVVAAGTVETRLSCGFGTATRTASVVAADPKPRTLTVTQTPDGYCKVELVALGGDVAVASANSTFSYALAIPPG